MIIRKIKLYRLAFPLLLITDDNVPYARFARRKAKIVILRFRRFQTEYLNKGPGSPPEKQPCRHHLCIVEYHQTARRDNLRQVREDSIRYDTFIIYKQF